MNSIQIKKKFFRFGALCVVIAFLASMPWAQVKTNGYFSYDYINEQVESGILKGTFLNPHMGFSLSGALTQNSNFFCEAFFTQGERVELRQAWVSLRFSDYFAYRLGLYMVPFGKYNESSRPYQTVFINPPLTAEYLYPRDWRDMGFLIEGRVKGFHYSAYVGNGLKESSTLREGLQFGDNNASQSVGGKLGLFIDQGFEVSYSHYRGKYDEEAERNLVYHGANIDWQTENFRVLAEYIKSVVENPFDFEEGEGEGYFVQVSIQMGSVIPVGSFQKIKYYDSFHGTGFLSPSSPGEGIELEEKRWSVGLVYKILENVMIKVEYDFNNDLRNEIKKKAMLCQMTLNF